MKKLIYPILLLFIQNIVAQEFITNFEDAKKTAKIQNKNILIIFSGSDWCAPCIKLDKNVFQTNEFKKASIENWIVVKADFPKKKNNQLSKEQTQNNRNLAELYNKDGSFPLVVLVNKTGVILGKIGYKNCSAIDYLKEIEKIEKK
jgi:thioredoxin-related protein